MTNCSFCFIYFCSTACLYITLSVFFFCRHQSLSPYSWYWSRKIVKRKKVFCRRHSSLSTSWLSSQTPGNATTINIEVFFIVEKSTSPVGDTTAPVRDERCQTPANALADRDDQFDGRQPRASASLSANAGTECSDVDRKERRASGEASATDRRTIPKNG